MVNAITNEIISRAEYLKEPIKTIYFGGGTPSILLQDELKRILDTIADNYTIEKEAELTLEANPDDIKTESLEMWKASGFNRLSIGIQSFKATDLEWMNRSHTADEAELCVQLCLEAGFNNITVDLIYGLPNLTMDQWREHIERVVDLGVPHISAYCLTVEEKTALRKWVEDRKIIVANEDQQSEQFLELIKILEDRGYEQYEISNYARDGYESKHNSGYWKGEKYLGIGPSAHSFNGFQRSWNIANNQQYMRGIEDSEPIMEVEDLSKEDIFNELILTGLRTSYGVEIEKLDALVQRPESFLLKQASFEEAGWLTISNGLLKLTKEGRLRADHIASELFID